MKENKTEFTPMDFSAITAPTNNSLDLAMILMAAAFLSGNNNPDVSKIKEDVAELKGKISIIEKMI